MPHNPHDHDSKSLAMRKKVPGMGSVPAWRNRERGQRDRESTEMAPAVMPPRTIQVAPIHSEVDALR